MANHIHTWWYDMSPLISDGNLFQSLVPFATKDDCPNVVLRFAVLQFLLVAPLVLIILFSRTVELILAPVFLEQGCSHT